MRKNKNAIIYLVCLLGLMLVVSLGLKTSSRILYKQNFISVEYPQDIKNGYKSNYDLKNKRTFNESGDAISKYKSYGSSANYEQAEKQDLIRFIKVKTPIWKIIINRYKITNRISKKTSDELLGGNYSKVKIYYNLRFLPTKLYAYSVNKNEWKLLRIYSYPYHSEKQFNKDFNEMVKAIKSGVFNEE